MLNEISKKVLKYVKKLNENEDFEYEPAKTPVAYIRNIKYATKMTNGKIILFKALKQNEPILSKRFPECVNPT